MGPEQFDEGGTPAMRILIAEDSDVVAMLLRAILDSEPDMEVIGRAHNGREAAHMVNELHPDLVTMDIRMPEMDGFEATRLIMSTRPTPIVVISSSVDDEELRITFRAIEEGALVVLEKPRGLTHPDFETIRREIVDMVRAMAEVKLVRRRLPTRPIPKPDSFASHEIQHPMARELVAIGISTGGPNVLRQLLGALPPAFPVPILVTQHISRGFLNGMVAWLRSNTLLEVKCAENGELLSAGTVYFAPESNHLLVGPSHQGLVARLYGDQPVNGFCPSATPMLKSVADVCGNKGVGLLMTGMGTDGAEGLLALRQRGGRTLVQDEESAIIYGMPGAAIALNAVDEVVKLDRLPAYLTALVGGRQS